MTPNELTVSSLASPVGELMLVSDAQGVLMACDYADIEDRLHRLLSRRLGPYRLIPGAAPRTVVAALNAYFAGDLAMIDAIPVHLNGSAFQNKAWRALRDIAPGRPACYGDQAARIGSPGAARAVGSANHHNPYNIILPCHRVVGVKGALTGYAGGLPRKRWLLDHEARHAGRPDRLL